MLQSPWVLLRLRQLWLRFFFMHVWHASEKLTKLVVIAALFFLPCCWASPMSDYATPPLELGSILLYSSSICGILAPTVLFTARHEVTYGVLQFLWRESYSRNSIL